MINKDQILEAFNFRYACKEFDADKKISDEDIKFILETGRLSPSSFGFEPWKFLVVQSPKIREELKEIAWGAQGQLPTASHFILFVARKAIDMKAVSDYMLYVMKDVKHMPDELIDMLGPACINWQKEDFKLDTDTKIFEWSSKQSYIALANMMTSAAAIGIDSCAIEGFNRDKVDDILRRENIVDTEHFGAALMMALGYRKSDSKVYPKTRQSYEDIVQWI